jgi:hypothetical protein
MINFTKLQQLMKEQLEIDRLSIAGEERGADEIEEIPVQDEEKE